MRLLACSDSGRYAVLRGDATWDQTGWGNASCPFTCIKPDMYKSGGDCADVPAGYYSPVGSDDVVQCSTTIGTVPSGMQAELSRGGGIDNCTVLYTKLALPAPVISPTSGEATVYTVSAPPTVSAATTPEHASDASAVEYRYTTDNTNVTASSPLLPAAGLELTSNTTVRVRAFHSAYYTSDESMAFFHVELAARSEPVLPLALTQGVVREVPAGTELQIGRSGEGQLWYVLSTSSTPDCSLSSSEWTAYSQTLTLASASSLTICSYVKEAGYMASEVARAELIVRPWSQPVLIQQLDSSSPLSSDQGALTLVMSAQPGAVIWYTLEPSTANETLCDARARAASVAPNLTLAADDTWQSVLGSSGSTASVCVGEAATRCQTEPMECW